MKKILILGAGRSSAYLVKYLLDQAISEEWKVTLADNDPENIRQKLKGHASGEALALDINNADLLAQAVSSHDLVISLLPPSGHLQVALECLKCRKHLITASYLSDQMKAMHADALRAGVLFLNECGLDPGIDHLSAMKIINQIKQQGGVIHSFRSYCGGLVAPEFDDNPWHYKFTWNPMNVVIAGQSTARFLDHGVLKFIPPSRIFSEIEQVSIPGLGNFECYANRDSLEYIEPYGIGSAANVLRGTLRGEGFCNAWNKIVKLGLNDNTFLINKTGRLTYRAFLNAFTPGSSGSLEERVCSFLRISEDSELFSKLKWLGLFEETAISLKDASPASVLLHLLEQKWKLNQGELDMIVMQHRLEYEKEGKRQELISTLIVKGEDEVYTAMAKTVGLPMGISAKLILNGMIKSRGVQIPISSEFYIPILKELAEYGIRFEV